MHNNFSKDEKLVIIFICIFVAVYVIFEKYKFISGKTAILILIISAGYLFFNRTIKYLLDLKINHDGFSARYVLFRILNTDRPLLILSILPIIRILKVIITSKKSTRHSV